MKKIASIAVIAIFAVGFTSCKKDYTCTCTWKVGNETKTQASAFGKQKKGDANDACDALETTYKMADPNAKCEL
ncbi:MAG: hypothetical protein EOP56_06840 [Sphingobacteriales bacterium]|nr:MAG: hypothetical protein EOP56_06840 [Sphingobacteriales bacterium]